jgi:formylglycine-generating enzyme required for sulfatase activity
MRLLIATALGVVAGWILPQCSPSGEPGEGAKNGEREAVPDGFMEFVAVGHAGNANDSTGFGSVSYAFDMGKYPVTNTQYAEFLNAVAKSDPHSLYQASMGQLPHGGIERQGTAGDYIYRVKPGMERKPVVFISWFDAARFCNWMHNGAPSGAAEPSTTEDGAYSLKGTASIVLPGTDPLHGRNGRNAGALYFLPAENEWYKAAYFQPATEGGDSDGYWSYPTRSNVPPTSGGPPGGDRSANFGGVLAAATDAGAYASSPGFYGTYDQAGNVWEWTEQIIKGSLRGVRGGSWLNDAQALTAGTRATGGPGFGAGENGFRVARRYRE